MPKARSEIEKSLASARISAFISSKSTSPILLREKHISYAVKNLYSLESTSDALAFVQPWVIYWNLHALDILDGVQWAFGDMINYQNGGNFTTELASNSLISSCVHSLQNCAKTYPEALSHLVLTRDHPLDVFVRAGLDYESHRLHDRTITHVHAKCGSCGFRVEWSRFEEIESRKVSLIENHRNYCPHCCCARSLLPHRSELVDTIASYFTRVSHAESIEPMGGYGGCVGQMPHLASTYAAVNSLVIIGGTKYSSAYESIPCQLISNWINCLYDGHGCFRMHVDGETDVRATYCALSVASLLNLRLSAINFPPTHGYDGGRLSDVSGFIMQSQTYEGGYSCLPYEEAHGGYTFCAVSSLFILENWIKIDLDSLMRWMAQRQSVLTGGFSGRTNKIEDACYGFWVGAIASLSEFATRERKCVSSTQEINSELSQRIYLKPCGKSESTLRGPRLLNVHNLANFNTLSNFLLDAAQDIEQGGFKDKPWVSADGYHTCYSLSGLAVAQRFVSNGIWKVRDVNPIYNLCHDRVSSALLNFRGKV